MPCLKAKESSCLAQCISFYLVAPYILLEVSIRNCSFKMLEVTVRTARPGDYHSVLEMSEGIYSGHDYLPCVFEKWLLDSTRAIFVAQVGRKVVGLRAVHIVDEGTTFISQALRIHPEFRGKSLSSRLIDAVHEYVRLNYPTVSRERFTTKSDNIQRLAIQKKYGDRAVFEQGILAFYVKKKKEIFSEIAAQVRPCTKKEFNDVILVEPAANVLFPGRTLVIDWEPFEAISSNADFLFTDADQLFVDGIANGYSNTQCPKSLSHGRPSPRVEHNHWVCTIYTDDPVLFRAHALEQLRVAHQCMPEEFIFSTFQRSSLNSCGRKFLGETLGLEPVEFFTFGLMLFERDFP